MLGDITTGELEILNAYQVLIPTGRKELKDYIRYLLCKQYKREVKVAIFQNKLLHNLFHSLLHIVEKDEFNINQITKRIQGIKELYWGIFGQVHCKYSEHINELDSNEVVKEFGRTSFENIERALQGGDSSIIRWEIIDFYQQYNKLSQEKDTRRIIAV